MSNTNNTPEQTSTPTETRTVLCGTEFIIRQTSDGTPIMKWGDMRYKHIVTIKANDTSKRFSFYGSVVDYQKNKCRLTEDDLINVLECILSDGIAGTMECKNFFDEFGYEDPCEGIKAYKACKDTLRRLGDMELTEDALYNMVNALHDMEE